MSRVLVLGTGAMGTLFAVRLARHGVDVTVCGTWTDALRALAAGARVDDGPATSVRAVRRRDVAGPFDVALVLVKSHATPEAAGVVSRTMDAGGVVLTLQNGLGHRELLRAATPAAVEAGVTTWGATLLEAGRVRSSPGYVLVSEESTVDPVARLLDAAGFDVRRTAEIDAALWRKLAVNCAINPLTAIHAIANGELPAHPEAGVAWEAAREVQRVARAVGHDDGGDWVAVAQGVARATSGNRSSMLQDVLRGRPTEIDALCGHVVREGARAGVPTPVNAALRDRVRAMMGLSCRS